MFDMEGILQKRTRYPEKEMGNANRKHISLLLQTGIRTQERTRREDGCERF